MAFLSMGLSAAVCVAMFVGTVAWAADPAPGKGKRAQEFIAAFNKGDAKAVAAFWTQDADYVDQVGH